MILFKDIYARAINLFDDPDYDRAYVQNIVRFEKMMYPHLLDGFQLFTNPTSIAWALVDQTQPSGQMEIFSGEDTKNNTVVLSTTPVENADFVCMINGEVDREAVYYPEKNTVQFSKNIATTDELSVEWYFGGQFNTDFVAASAPLISTSLIGSKVVDILARALVIAWAEKNKNFILEIRNVLTDTDFKIYSPANAIKSKVDWVKDLVWELDTLQTKLAWDVRSVYHRSGGYYGA